MVHDEPASSRRLTAAVARAATGSERQKTAEAEGGRLREASSINRSLSALGLVIKRLAAGAAHIPYRDSRLTFLLQARARQQTMHLLRVRRSRVCDIACVAHD